MLLQKGTAYKPLGSEVIAFNEAKNSGILYNIAVKRTLADEVNGSQPSFALMSDILIEQLKKVKLPLKRVRIQSFDTMVLEYIHAIYATYKIAFLTHQNDFETNMKTLNFVFEMYILLYYIKRKLKRFIKKNRSLMPWTVNKKEDLIYLLE